ncbi:MAG TPA: hypothetical protein VMK66_01210, partial [Myxococcales bacterium]|nr:hypothetical protein [Myxococcales bacterium]
ALGDLRLLGALAALLLVSTALYRLALRRKRLPEEALDEEPAKPAPQGEPIAGTARAHLR